MDVVENELAINNVENHGIGGWGELKYNWYADLYRYTGRPGKKLYLHELLRNPSYRYTFLMRLCTYLSQNKKNILKRIAFRFFYEIFRYYAIRCCIEITYNTKIGSGLYLPHLVGIVVHRDAVIGKNCCISQNVTIGELHRGEREGNPIIGDNVYIAPGAVIMGKIKIGNNVAIGANSVVNKDLPNNAVAVGIPARVISFKGSTGYVNRIDY